MSDGLDVFAEVSLADWSRLQPQGAKQIHRGTCAMHWQMFVDRPVRFPD